MPTYCYRSTSHTQYSFWISTLLWRKHSMVQMLAAQGLFLRCPQYQNCLAAVTQNMLSTWWFGAPLRTSALSFRIRAMAGLRPNCLFSQVATRTAQHELSFQSISMGPQHLMNLAKIVLNCPVKACFLPSHPSKFLGAATSTVAGPLIGECRTGYGECRTV